MTDEQRTFVEHLLSVQDEMLASILEAAKGYRTKAIEAGFSEPVAEQMASDFHRLTVENLVANFPRRRSS